MSRLEDTYVNENIGAKLVISKANDSNGEIAAALISSNGTTFLRPATTTSRTTPARPRSPF